MFIRCCIDHQDPLVDICNSTAQYRRSLSWSQKSSSFMVEHLPEASLAELNPSLRNLTMWSERDPGSELNLVTQPPFEFLLQAVALGK